MTKKLDRDATTTPLRPRDMLVIKLVNWTDDGADNCQAYDVEVYINGKFDNARSDVFEFGKSAGVTKKDALKLALEKVVGEVDQFVSETLRQIEVKR